LFDTAEQAALVAARVGYPRLDIEDMVRRLYPDADAPAVVEQAIQEALLREGQEELLLEREDRKSVDAEHDLGRSMHDDD
jgi:hypothetical protein